MSLAVLSDNSNPFFLFNEDRFVLVHPGQEQLSGQNELNRGLLTDRSIRTK